MQTPGKGFIDHGTIETDRTAGDTGLIAYYKFDDDDPPTASATNPRVGGTGLDPTGTSDGVDPWEGGTSIDPDA